MATNGQEAEKAQEMFTQLSQIEGAALSTWGNSDTWQKNLINVLRIFELFRKYCPAMILLLPVPWIELPFETLASAHMYDCFAKYLLLFYIIETGVNVGQTLSGDVTTNHICTLINMAKRLIVGHTAHAGLGEAQWFFTCLDGGTSVQVAAEIEEED